MKALIRRAAGALVRLYRREPVRVGAFCTAIVVAGAARLGYTGVDAEIAGYVGFALPLIVGEISRNRVTPVATGVLEVPMPHVNLRLQTDWGAAAYDLERAAPDRWATTDAPSGDGEPPADA